MSGTTKYGSLCSGIGGLDMAVEAAFGYRAAWHAEVEPHASSVLSERWPGVPNLGDFTAVDWSAVEPVSLICAGYPCQPFSHAGERRGEADARHLWPHVAEAVRVLRPRWVVLENVAGHLSLGFGAVLADLAEAGFDAEWCLLRASDVGAPHARARLFVVARNTNGARTDARPARRASRHRSGESGGTIADAERADRGPAARLGAAAGQHLGSAGRVEGAASSCGDRPTPADPSAVGQQGVGQPFGMGAPHAGAGSGERPVPDAPHVGHERSGEARRRGPRPADDSAPAPDAYGAGGEALCGRPGAGHVGRLQPLVGGDTAVAWGEFEPAIRRWERVLGRPAPQPTDAEGRLAPPFVEWMMGYPEGWVGSLKRNPALRCLGNAVCPQQGAAALSLLLEAHEAVAA